MKFRFKEQEKVKVVRKGLQYVTYWKAYEALINEYIFSVAHRPYIIGVEFGDIPEDTEFTVLSRGYVSTSSGYKNLYLIAPKKELEEQEQAKGLTRPPLHLYVIDEDGLEEYSKKMGVWFCEYRPVDGKIPKLRANFKCTEEEMKWSGFSLDTVNKTRRKTYYVHVKAVDDSDAKAKAQKLFVEYFSKLYNEKSKEYEAELEEISDNLHKVRHWND